MSFYSSVAFVGQLLRAYGAFQYMHLVKCKNPSARLDEFRNGSARVMIITDKHTVGIKLQCASALIFWDVPTSADVRDQATGRIVRKGQRKDCWIYTLQVDGTYSNSAWTLFRMKKSVSVTLDRAGSQAHPALDLRQTLSADVLGLAKAHVQQSHHHLLDPSSVQQAFQQTVAQRLASKLTEQLRSCSQPLGRQSNNCKRSFVLLAVDAAQGFALLLLSAQLNS